MVAACQGVAARKEDLKVAICAPEVAVIMTALTIRTLNATAAGYLWPASLQPRIRTRNLSEISRMMGIIEVSFT
jgi:hypothetical protein